jgi:hypothetical protein
MRCSLFFFLSLLANDEDIPLPNGRAGVIGPETMLKLIVFAILQVPTTPAVPMYVHHVRGSCFFV